MNPVIVLNLGAANSGLTDLTAQLRLGGADSGEPIEFGFVEAVEGSGCYEWTYDLSSFAGTIAFYSAANPSKVWLVLVSAADVAGPAPVELSFVDGAGNPVPSVHFSVLAGSTLLGAMQADSGGHASFGVEPGAYAIAAAITAGISFAPYALTVAGSTAATISGSLPAAAPTPPAAGILAQGYAVDSAGNLLAGAEINYCASAAPAGAGSAIDGDPQNAVSSSAGLLQFGVIPGATYKIWSSINPPIIVTVPIGQSSPFILPNLIFSTLPAN